MVRGTGACTHFQARCTEGVGKVDHLIGISRVRSIDFNLYPGGGQRHTGNAYELNRTASLDRVVAGIIDACRFHEGQAERHIFQRKADGPCGCRGVAPVNVPVTIAVLPVGTPDPHKGVDMAGAHFEHVDLGCRSADKGNIQDLALFKSKTAAQMHKLRDAQGHKT